MLIKERFTAKRRFFFLRILSALSLVLVLSISLPPDAAAFESPGAGAQESADGSVNIIVSVESTVASGGSGGGAGGGGTGVTSQQVEATVLPICYYKPHYTGAEAQAWVEHIHETYEDKERAQRITDSLYPDAKARAAEDGMWYARRCDRSRAANDEEYKDAMKVFYEKNKELRVWVPAGSQPPTPPIPGSVLARAAMEAITIPAPTVETNPQLGDSGATLVGYDTWVWATGDTPISITATATAGSTTAEVTASSSGLSLSAPDSEVECTGFGREWTPSEPDGATSDCMINFTRSSAHLGGTTPLKVQVTYGVSWSSSDGSGGTLNSVSTNAEFDIPVAEAQTLNSGES